MFMHWLNIFKNLKLVPTLVNTGPGVEHTEEREEIVQQYIIHTITYKVLDNKMACQQHFVER